MSSAHILRCYIYSCFCVFFRTPGIIQWLNDLYTLREINMYTVQFFMVQLDAQQNFTDLGSPAPQDLSKALFMAVTWRCNMPSQGHEPSEKLTTPSKNHFVRILQSDNFNPIGLQYFLASLVTRNFSCRLQFEKRIQPGTSLHSTAVLLESLRFQFSRDSPD